MAISSIAYQATVLTGNPIANDWLNDTGADVEIGSIVLYGLVYGIVSGGNSQDGSTKVLSTARGTAIFGPPGLKVDAPAFTTDSWATGSLLYWDATNYRLTSTAVSAANGGKKIGYAANSKAAATSNAVVFFNQTIPA